MTNSKLKQHLTKHKGVYSAAGFLFIGIGVGYLVRHMMGKSKYSVDHKDVPTIDDLFRDRGKLDDAVEYIERSGAKIIGKFSEVDGEEYASFHDLRMDKLLIGSTSADIGDVELYYDNDGTTYAVAHNFEDYYGKKPTSMKPTGKKIYT